jgi:hypothetical protein
MAMKRVASADAFGRKPEPMKRPMFFDCLYGKL